MRRHEITGYWIDNVGRKLHCVYEDSHDRIHVTYPNGDWTCAGYNTFCGWVNHGWVKQ